MNKLNVIVKLYEKFLHKPSVNTIYLVCKAILLIYTVAKKPKYHKLALISSNILIYIKQRKQKHPLKLNFFSLFPKDWQDGSQNTDDGKSNSLRSPSL